MNISNIIWKRNQCTHNESKSYFDSSNLNSLFFLIHDIVKKWMVARKAGNRKRRIERFERLSLSITIQPSFIIFPGARIRVLCARQNIATRLKSLFLRAQCVTRTAMLKSACCKRTTRIEIDAYGEPRAARGLVDTIRSGTTTTDSRPGKFDPFAPSTIEK